tara:strand:- start:243 stop:461 length:219 start_codon:yes stop_codon:yes gene_type:complete
MEENNLALFQKYSKNKDDFFESKETPMHPNLFLQLSNVIGFNKLNGRNYPEYINIWLKKNNLPIHQEKSTQN